ncbi:MAG: hypothetical protein IKV10_00745, partial [Alphaproteobacteria bacterium]|nr:hypothetical protein [Alphaproteobacteria bacterium]
STAQKAFENMYKIYKNGFAEIQWGTDIKGAYMIAGGDADSYSWTAEMSDEDKAEIREFISSKAPDLLDKYFDRDPDNADAWIIKNRAQDLSNIEFTNPTGTDTVTFTLNEHGEIIGLKDSTNQYKRLSRNSANFQTQQATKEYTDVTTINLQTFGSKNKLTYADFGFKTTSEVRKFNDSTPNEELSKRQNVFAGGYDLKNISREAVADLDTELKFDGTAIGIVTGTDGTQIKVAGNATLNFKDRIETLNADFCTGSTTVEGETRWYNMLIESNGTESSISFTQTNEIDEQYQLSDLNPSGNYDGMRVDYYGDRGNPTEFVGTATYADTNGVSMEAAFGGTLVKPTEN